MNEKSNHKAGFGSVEDRIRVFHDCMEPALHLFPQDIAEKLTEGGFFTAPASTKYHGAYEGGLFDHSRNVTSALVTLTHDNDLEWQRSESPYIIGMFHDICKQDQYRHPLETRSTRRVWNFILSMKAAGSMSLTRCSRDTATNPSCCSPNIYN